MSVKLKHIPSLLQIIRQFESVEGVKPLIKDVKKIYDNLPVSEATFPNFELTSNFCIRADLLKKDNSIIRLTDLGNEFLDAFTKDGKFNEKLINDFAIRCILKGSFKEEVENALSHFSHDEDIWCYPEIAVSLFSDPSIISLLYECKILELGEDKVFFNPNYLGLLSIKKKVPDIRISQNQIDSQLEIMKKVGNIAEEIALAYEINRLKDKGCISESKNVQRISQGFANAGYDITSFNEKASNLDTPDRFIEVKGSTGLEFEIHWSSNEIKKAQELGSKYWLYFVGGIDIQTQRTDQIPLTIPDPFKNIFENEKYIHECDGYRITKSGN